MSSYTPAEIRQSGFDNGWVDPVSLATLNPRAIYDAALAYGVSAAELDAAFPEWGPPGTVAQFIASQGWPALPEYMTTATVPVPVVTMAPAPVYTPPTSAPAPVPVSARAIHPTYVPPIETVAMPYPYQPTGATLPDIVTGRVQPVVEPFPTPQPARLSPAAVLLGAGAVALLLLKR